MADQGNNTSSSSEYSDERAARPAPGTNEYFNEMIYCTCKRCQNRKLKKRRLVRIHRLNYGVYIEEPFPVPNILEEPMDVTDDSHSQDEEDTFMDETTLQINEAISKVIPAPIRPFSTSSIMPVVEFDQDSCAFNKLILLYIFVNICVFSTQGICRVIPTSVHLVGMQGPTMTSNTSSVMPKDISRVTPTSTQSIGIEGHVMPSTARPETPITKVASSAKPHSMPSTSNTGVPSVPVELGMHVPVRSTSQLKTNSSNVGSVRIFPPTLGQDSVRSLIDSQSRILRLLPDTPENFQVRQEIIRQIQLWKKALLESAGPTSDEQEINDKVTNVPIRAFTSTPKTTTISSVTTKGLQEVTILLTPEGNVLKDEMGLKFFHFIFHRAEQLFGNTIQMDWRKQTNAKKEELFKDVITAFGNPGFNKEIILDIACKYIHSKRDNLRSKLTKDLRYPCPAWITNQVTWDELIKDAKFKRKARNKPNYRPSARGGKRRLRDTMNATQARVSRIGSHKLGSGGYNSIRGGMVHQFQKEASEEDLKYALLHGYQGLQQHMIDRGEKLITGHESEKAQQSNSSEASGSEHEEEIRSHDESFVAHNDSIVIPETRQETIVEFQQMGDKNNEEGAQCDEQSTPTIRVVPIKKRTRKGWIEKI